MPVTSGTQSTEANLNATTPAVPSGERNVTWQAGAPYPDPNNPGYQVRDISAHVPNVGGDDPRSTTSETIGTASTGKCVTFADASPAAPITVALDSTVADTFTCSVLNKSTQTITLTPSTGDVDDGTGAASSQSLSAGNSCELFKTSAGSPAVAHWRMLRGAGTGGGGSLPSGTPNQVVATDASGSSTNVAALRKLVALDLAVSPVDGQMIVADSSLTQKMGWKAPVVLCMATIPGKPSAGQIIGSFDFQSVGAVTFAGNFSGSGGSDLTGQGGQHPTATVTCQVYKNNTNIGAISVSTSGVWTFTTTSGLAITFNSTDVLTVIAPGSQDATWQGFTFTLFGGLGLAAPAAITNPAVAWKGAYSGGAYDTYNFVSYYGGVYIALQPVLAGNAPTLDGNNANWAFMMGDGYSDQGVYNPATLYHPNQTVRFIETGKSGYSTFRCYAQPPTAGIAPSNTTYWVPLAQAGADGAVTGVQIQGQTFTYVIDSGSADHILTAPSPAWSSYSDGMQLMVRIAANNTGATDINVSGLGVKSVVNADGSALTAGSLKANGDYPMMYNFTLGKMQLTGGGGGGGLNIQTVDGATIVSGATQLNVPNGSVTNPSGSIAQIAGGMIEIAKADASGSTALLFPSVFSTVFNSYFILIEDILPSVNGTDFLIQFTLNNGSSYDNGANYRNILAYTYSGGQGIGVNQSGATSLMLHGGGATSRIGNTTTTGGCDGWAVITRVNDTSAYKRIYGLGMYLDTSVNDLVESRAMCRYNVTTAPTGFKAFPASGNFTTGRITVFGFCA